MADEFKSLCSRDSFRCLRHSSAGFSLRDLVLASADLHGPKPPLLKPAKLEVIQYRTARQVEPDILRRAGLTHIGILPVVTVVNPRRNLAFPSE